MADHAGIVSESHSREIAERATGVRAMLDLREGMRGSKRILVWVVSMGGYFAGVRLIHILLPGWGFVAAPIMTLAPILLFAVWFHAKRRQRLRESRAKMLCPRCQYILREDGPDSWMICDDTVRVCSECAYAVSDDVYAAAALPTVRVRATRVIVGSSGTVTGCVLLVVLSIGGLAAATIAFSPIDRLWWWFAAVAVSQIVVMALAILFVRRVHRAIDARVASWRVAPFCTKCDAALPDGARELSLAVCGECGRRMSPPATLAEARRAAIR